VTAVAVALLVDHCAPRWRPSSETNREIPASQPQSELITKDASLAEHRADISTARDLALIAQ
jgi:hypothetical protein